MWSSHIYYFRYSLIAGTYFCLGRQHFDFLNQNDVRLNHQDNRTVGRLCHAADKTRMVVKLCPLNQWLSTCTGFTAIGTNHETHSIIQYPATNLSKKWKSVSNISLTLLNDRVATNSTIQDGDRSYNGQSYPLPSHITCFCISLKTTGEIISNLPSAPGMTLNFWSLILLPSIHHTIPLCVTVHVCGYVGYCYPCHVHLRKPDGLIWNFQLHSSQQLTC